jgi:hypothetical protein
MSHNEADSAIRHIQRLLALAVAPSVDPFQYVERFFQSHRNA